MEFSDALMVTALGMGTVFAGLVLTSLLILSFSWFGERRPAVSSPAGEAVVSPPRGAPVVVEPDVLAVITTVLEIERRLYRAEHARASAGAVPAQQESMKRESLQGNG